MKETDKYILNIDMPTQKKQASRQIELQGWLILKNKAKNPKLRIKQGTKTIEVKFGIWRHDVAVAFPNYQKELTEYSGFEEEFECVTDKVDLQLNTGDGFQTIYEFQFEVTSPFRQYNPALATNWMDHKNLIETKKFYNYEPLTYEKPGSQTKNKAIAFYLPQFHPIEENDKAWGKGFTEWINVASAEPRFVGHNQPLLPGELGYYDLRLEENIKAQIDMAKNHDLYGFCIYYYWFSGKKVLDMPINTIIKHQEWDFNFMICWANENWTKRWDGRDKDVIFEQKYRDEDPLEFIKEVEHILLDPRYIRVNGKPILSVYRCEHLDDAKRYAKVWREYFREKHQLELELVSVMSFFGEDPKTYDFDAGLDFSPSNILRSNDETLKVTISVKNKLIDPFYDGTVFDYRAAVNKLIKTKPALNARIYGCVVPSWDNDARKKGHGSYVFYNESPSLYKKLLDHAFQQTDKETPFVFINAWNEWAEGTVLEPTRSYGYTLLNKTRESINNSTVIEDKSNKIAILYIDTAHHLADLEKSINILTASDFDVKIAVCSDDLTIAFRLREFVAATATPVTISEVPERGGDILPFVEMIKKIDYKHCDVIVKLAFVENRESPLNFIKNKQMLARHVKKVLDDKTIVFSGVARATTKQASTDSTVGPILSFVAPGAVAERVTDLDLLPEDFSVKTLKESQSGVIENIPLSFLEVLNVGCYVSNTTRLYKKCVRATERV